MTPDHRFNAIRGRLTDAETAMRKGDAAMAAGYAHEAARWAINLADELRYEHGIQAGLNRAAMDAKDKRRKRRPTKDHR